MFVGPRRDVHQRSVSARDHGRASADRGGLDGGADARASRGVDWQRRRDPVRRHDRRGRARGRRGRGHRATCRRARRSPACRRGCWCGERTGRPHDRDRRHRLRLLGAEPGPQFQRMPRRRRAGRVRPRARAAAAGRAAVSRLSPSPTSAAELCADPTVDAVVIATPVEHHFELAMAALRAGKHVLVEKPMASSSEQAAG